MTLQQLTTTMEIEFPGAISKIVWLKSALITVCLFNLADAVFTLYWVLTNRAVEANPLMAHLIAVSPALFVVMKIALVSFGCMILWRFRKHKLAVASTVGVLIVYTAIIMYHLYGVNTILIASLH